MKQTKIIISQNSINSDELYDIVYSNVTVINLLLEQGLTENEIHKDALASYYVDYYVAQVENGGFSQYIYNSKWKNIVNDRVSYGLEKISAIKNLDYFNKKRTSIDNFAKDKIDDFFSSDYFGDNQIRDELNDDDFYNLEENITELNAKWLKTHSDTTILSIDNMFLALEEIVGKKIER